VFLNIASIWEYCTDKNHEKIMRKRQKTLPNPLKMRIFLSKLANNSPILTKTFPFWENWGKLSVPFFKFSYDFCQCADVGSYRQLYYLQITFTYILKHWGIWLLVLSNDVILAFNRFSFSLMPLIYARTVLMHSIQNIFLTEIIPSIFYSLLMNFPTLGDVTFHYYQFVLNWL